MDIGLSCTFQDKNLTGKM